MDVAATGRTWDDATSPAVLRLTRRFEQAWRGAQRTGASRPDPAEFLNHEDGHADPSGALLALLRTDLTLRWEVGERIGAQWYLDRYPDLGEDTTVALAYEEFCLREEEAENPDPAEFLDRFPKVAGALRRVLDIHRLVGAGTTTTAISLSSVSISSSSSGMDIAFPEAGQTIAGFYLVEELGRGAFARVFLARERQLADRPVALKVTRRGSREPQTLARLQHTHIVPVYSHQEDRITGLHLLCMPYFGRVTLAQALAAFREQQEYSGRGLVAALDRLEPSDTPPSARSHGRAAIVGRSFPRAVAWWGARLAEALEHAHDQGVLHRDIKPSNVLVTSDCMPMLLDFNLAREPVVEEETVTTSATLGGTVDYMAPEHLDALADGLADRVDGRSDLYGLGVVVYEALAGRKPFSPPRKGASVIETLTRAADERRQGVPQLGPKGDEIPPAFKAVIRRCMEPEPDDRYQTAADLAADLQAVADDLPLIHAREPLVSKVSRRLRHNRRLFAMAAVVLLAGAAVLGALINFQLERSERYDQIKQFFEQGMASYDAGDFKKARVQFDAAVQLAQRSELGTLRNLLKWRSVTEFGGKVRRKFQSLQTYPGLDQLEDWARQKAQLADRIDTTRGHAEALHEAADSLRFHLIGLGDDLTGAVRELQSLLTPFYVLTSRGDWTKLDHIWKLLTNEQSERLRSEVNELLFLWMVGIDTSFRAPGESEARERMVNDPETIKLALAVCDRALAFAEPKAPWLALQHRLESHRDLARTASTVAVDQGQRKPADANRLADVPAHVEEESSALACFQWGLLCSSQGRKAQAIEWLLRAVRLDWSNYWYQFYLAYLEDQAGLNDDALDHYSVAVALQPHSPWVRFSRARLYRAKGRWSWAIDDLSLALDELQGRPEALQVRLELGYVYQALGNFQRARQEYKAVISASPGTPYGIAARLNLANLDAESGEIRRAFSEYEVLLAIAPNDMAVRMSRALLELRLGSAAEAEADLTILLNSGTRLKNRDEVLAARAMARLLLRHASEAVLDAEEAQRIKPSPAHERLWQRAVLAAHRWDDFKIDRPEELALLPVGGPSLEADLKAAAKGLVGWATTINPKTYRAALSLALVRAGLGDYAGGAEAAGYAIKVSPFSPRTHLIRARVLYQAGKYELALADIEKALKTQPDEPGSLELRGVLRTAMGNPSEALGDFDQAIAHSAHHFVHVHKATALVALGDYEEAVHEWSIALRKDPELPRAFLGRARCYVRLRLWDLALADLEQAAAWSHSDPWLETAIVATYFQCLRERPDQFSRWFTLFRRTSRHLWNHAVGSRSFLPAPVSED